MKTTVNPDILIWARKTLNLTIDDVSKKIKQDNETIQRWENGEDYPTYAQLENLAYSVYKRPIAVFFFPAPPKDIDIKNSFRTLPGHYLDNLSPEMMKQLRHANSSLENLYELLVNNDRIDRLNDLKNAAYRLDMPTVLKKIRTIFDVKIEDQYRWKDEDAALKNWRRKIESLGIFVFKDAFHDKSISGFCVYDENFPIIYLNNSVSKTRQIFTLFHELSHILYQTSGMDFSDDIDYSVFDPSNEIIERNCNEFSGNFLLSSEIVDEIIKTGSDIRSSVEHYSKLLKISREMIAVRLMKEKIVSYDTYLLWKNEWDEYKNVVSKGNGNYYNNIGTYISERYAIEVYKKYYDGTLLRDKACDYLNVNDKAFSILENHFVM